MNKTVLYFFALGLLFLSLPSCNQSGGQGRKEKIHTGRLAMAADAGLEKVIRQHTVVFQNLYDSVQVAESYADEATVIDRFRRGEANVMLLTRKLTEAERKQMIDRDTLYVRELDVAFDAIVMIAGKDFDDSSLDSATLKGFFTKPSPASPLLVFDSRNTSISAHMLQWAGGKKEAAPQRMYAANSVQEVVDYVAQQPNCIGFIPYQYISDEDENGMQDLQRRVKILSLRTLSEEGASIRATANQSDIAMRYYPLTRTVNSVIRYGHQDNPEWWFMSFLYREKGAKVFLKAGYVPARIPQREIIVNTGEIPETK